MTTTSLRLQENKQFFFHVKDPVSAGTHFAGFLCAIAAMPALLIHASQLGATRIELISYTVFMLSMVLLYGASTAYHTFIVSKKTEGLLKRIDHMSICVLIAGTYTPFCVVALPPQTGNILLGLVWTLAGLGMLFKLFWVYCPKWVSSVIYIAMGWTAIIFLPQLVNALPTGAFILLLLGGLLYSVGAIIYALKLKLFTSKSFGNHELFHCFVLAGTLCHFLCIYIYVCML